MADSRLTSSATPTDVRRRHMPIVVALVEDHPDMRAGTSLILRASPGVNVVGEYGTAEDFFAGIREPYPDVVLMDINLPGMSGIEATARLKNDHPRIEIVVLSVLEDDDNIFRAICAGASGYVTKPVMPQDLIEAVEHAFGGGTPISPHIARKMLDLFRQKLPAPREEYQLTPREREVLERLVQGDDYQQIADRFFLSLFTVRAHIRNIYDKLHVHSKSQAVAKALREKVFPPK